MQTAELRGAMRTFLQDALAVGGVARRLRRGGGEEEEEEQQEQEEEDDVGNWGQVAEAGGSRSIQGVDFDKLQVDELLRCVGSVCLPMCC